MDHLGGYFLMPYEKNHASHQDDECFANQRNMLDVRTWNRDLINQTFYKTCHDNKNKYMTIKFKWNPFIESLKHMISNPIDGAPPKGGVTCSCWSITANKQMTQI
tara:strand:+ start:115 stop:429 length:315 start_codon:yes stop_codon:yes gene_type:complete